MVAKDGFENWELRAYFWVDNDETAVTYVQHIRKEVY